METARRTTMERTKFFCLFLWLIGLLISSASGQSYTITDLGTLGGKSSGASAINDIGQVVGAADMPTYGNWRGFIWDFANGMYNLGNLNGPSWCNSSAYDINNAGQVVGDTDTSDYRNHAFLWESGIMTDLGGTFGGEYSTARFINNSGQVVGGAITAGVGHSVLYDKGVANNLGNLLLNNYDWILSGVLDINNNGQILGEGRKKTDPGSYQRPFIWDNLGGLVDLSNDLIKPSNACQIISFNDNGQVTGMVNTSQGRHLFLWDKASGMRDLGSFGDSSQSGGFGYGRMYHTGPWSINNVAQIVGTLPKGGDRAFLWDNAQGLMDLNNLIPADSSWILTDARDINNRGQIVGEGWNQKIGATHAFLLTPPLNPISPKRQDVTLETPSGDFTSQHGIGLTDDFLKISLSIRLIGVDPGEDLKRIWEEGIERIWSNQYNIVSVAGEYPIIMDVKFVDQDEDIIVKVIEGDYLNVNVVEWCTGKPAGWDFSYQDRVAAHEFGHIIGLYDEYYQNGRGTLDPDNPFIDPTMTSIMATPDGMPKERHFQSILEWLEGETGYDMILAQSPLWRPGESGPPVNDGAPIPEPASIILLILGGMGLVFRQRYKKVQ